MAIQLANKTIEADEEGFLLDPKSLSDLGDRSEQGGRARPVFRSFAENSRRYLTKRIGKMDRCPTGAVDQPQVRQAPSRTNEHR